MTLANLKLCPEALGEHVRSNRIFFVLNSQHRGQHVVTVFGRIIGKHTVAPAAMEPVSKSLRTFGAPAWLVGTMWWKDQLVLLIGLFGAIRATEVGKKS